MMAASATYLLLFHLILSYFHVASACPSVCTCDGVIVDCSGKNLRKIPKNIPRNTEILHLSNNKISHVTKTTFRQLKGLHILILAGNQIKEIPGQTFFHQKKVMTLDLSRNRLTVLYPSSFKGLIRLETLSLAYNQITSLASSLTRTPEIVSLNAMTNNITAINHKEFRTNKRLMMADISHNLIRRVHAKAFENNHNLRYLIMKNNPIGKQMPALKFGKSRLSLVDFSQCDLHKFPSGLPQSVMDLRLQKNEIDEVSKYHVKRMTRLRVLTLSDNKIKKVAPGAFKKTKLQDLSMNSNALTEIPMGLPKTLRKLNLDSNQIRLIETGTIDNKSGIEVLSLRQNILDNMKAGAIQSKMLKNLDLKGNQITTLKTGMLSGMNTVQVLSLSNNPIRVIEKNCCDNFDGLLQFDMSYIMEEVNVSQNILESMPQLREVEFVNSPHLVKSIMKMIAVKGNKCRLPELESMNLMYNRLETLPSQLRGFLPIAQAVFLDGNPLVCDSRLVWLKRWMKSELVIFTKNGELKCDKPMELRGMAIKNVPDDEFVLYVKPLTTTTTTQANVIATSIADDIIDDKIDVNETIFNQSDNVTDMYSYDLDDEENVTDTQYVSNLNESEEKRMKKIKSDSNKSSEINNNTIKIENKPKISRENDEEPKVKNSSFTKLNKKQKSKTKIKNNKLAAPSEKGGSTQKSDSRQRDKTVKKNATTKSRKNKNKPKISQENDEEPKVKNSSFTKLNKKQKSKTKTKIKNTKYAAPSEKGGSIQKSDSRQPDKTVKKKVTTKSRKNKNSKKDANKSRGKKKSKQKVNKKMSSVTNKKRKSNKNGKSSKKRTRKNRSRKTNQFNNG